MLTLKLQQLAAQGSVCPMSNCLHACRGQASPQALSGLWDRDGARQYSGRCSEWAKQRLQDKTKQARWDGPLPVTWSKPGRSDLCWCTGTASAVACVPALMEALGQTVSQLPLYIMYSMLLELACYLKTTCISGAIAKWCLRDAHHQVL